MADRKRTHEIRDPIHTFIKVDNREREIIATKPFQRLRNIHQLALTYMVYPGATHRRFEHSLGVMELAGRVFDVITDPEHIKFEAASSILPDQGELPYWRRVLRAAALCHDIGHLPFSHAAEKELLPDGQDHESLTVALIESEFLSPVWSSEADSPINQGVPLATMEKLARYWMTNYDWRKIESKMNSYPQFITEIDGLDIHFIHVRSRHENALPLIVTHGWPGSIIEQIKIIDPLTDPTAHGGSAADAFHVVIPSIPGYGFSGRPTTTGWDTVRIARAWTVLMKRLGYTKFVAQGGDWGAVVVDQMGVQAPPELLGIHTNMAGVIPLDIEKAAQAGAPTPSGLSADERLAYERLRFVYTKGVGYAYQLGLRPQTLYGIADSPVGLAAYLLDHDAWSLELISRAFDGHAEGLTRDDVLDNITLTWLTNTGVSSGRLYWENKASFFGVKGVSIPVAVSAFPDELYQAPRSWAERAYPKLIHYNKLDKGGHFAAWEQPKIFTEEVRAGFRSLRK